VVPSICPASLAYGTLSESTNGFLITEFIDVNARKCGPGSGVTLAQKLTKLHTSIAPIPEGKTQPSFGFPVTTYCGPTPQNNSYTTSWAKFFAENRLRSICKTIEEQHGAETELVEWVEKIIAKVVPRLLGNGHLGGRKGIQPVLVHGDLWHGNKARGQVGDKGGVEDVIFDPSCCYAHSEYELAIMRMFAGFSASFFSEYHHLVPKTEPREEYDDRMELYGL
jgi:protein-ribulosamine 3-kinase